MKRETGRRVRALTVTLVAAGLGLAGCQQSELTGQAAGAQLQAVAPATPEVTASETVTPETSPSPSVVATAKAETTGTDQQGTGQTVTTPTREAVPTTGRRSGRGHRFGAASATGSAGQESSAATTETPAERPTTTTEAGSEAHPTATTTTTAANPATPGGVWHPAPGLTWQWQLTGTPDLSVNADVFDLDAFNTTAAEVSSLHAKGRKAICYVDAGSSEDYRPDAASIPASVQGSSNGWPGERWLDIRQQSVILPVMAKRFDICKSKGFDAVEPDNLEAYNNNSGFPLTAADQISFNTAIAKLAHDRGMAVGLKNDLDQIPQLVPSFDFAVNEQCVEYNECDSLTPFIKAGKAVFATEYSGSSSSVCGVANKLGLSTLIKKLELDATRTSCN